MNKINTKLLVHLERLLRYKHAKYRTHWANKVYEMCYFLRFINIDIVVRLRFCCLSYNLFTS